MTNSASSGQVVSRDGQPLATQWVDGHGIVGIRRRAFDVAGGHLVRGDDALTRRCASRRGRSIDEERAALDVVALLDGGTTAVVLFESNDSAIPPSSSWSPDCFVAANEGERARLLRRQRIALPGPPEEPGPTFVEFDSAPPEVAVEGAVRAMQPVAMFVLSEQRRALVGYAAWLSGEKSRVSTQVPASQTEVTSPSSRTTAPMTMPDAARRYAEATPFRPSDRPAPAPSAADDDWSSSMDDEATVTGSFVPADAQALPWQARSDAPHDTPSEPPAAGARPAAPPEGWRPLPHFPSPAVPAVAPPVESPSPSPPPPAPKPEAPPIPPRSRVVDLLWKSDDVDVLGRARQWANVESPRPRGLLPRLGREALVEPPPRDWLSDGRAYTMADLATEAGRLAGGAGGESEALERPAVVVAGVLSLDVSLGDELEAIRAALAHLAPRHKPVQRALEATKSIEPGPLTPLAVLRAGIDELMRAAQEAGHGGPGLETTARRALIRARRHRELELLGGPHVVGRWRDRERDSAWVVYLPKSAAPSLPLEIELVARAAVTVHPRCDPDEPGKWALRIHALARVLQTGELEVPS